MKIRAARYENDFFVYKILWKSLLKQFARILKNRKQKKIILLAIKNIRNENYSNAVNLTNKVVFNKNLKFIDVSCANVAIKKIFININLNLRTAKYKKIKLIKFNSVEVVEITKKFKKLTQIIKEQLNSIDVIKLILNTFIEIRLRKLFNISFELFIDSNNIESNNISIFKDFEHFEISIWITSIQIALSRVTPRYLKILNILKFRFE